MKAIFIYFFYLNSVILGSGNIFEDVFARALGGVLGLFLILGLYKLITYIRIISNRDRKREYLEEKDRINKLSKEELNYYYNLQKREENKFFNKLNYREEIELAYFQRYFSGKITYEQLIEKLLQKH